MSYQRWYLENEQKKKLWTYLLRCPGHKNWTFKFFIICLSRNYPNYGKNENKVKSQIRINVIFVIHPGVGECKMGWNSSREKEIGLPLYAIVSMQDEPKHFLGHSAVLGHRKRAKRFLSHLFYPQFGIVKRIKIGVLNLFHNIMT